MRESIVSGRDLSAIQLTMHKFMTYGNYQIMEFTKFGDDFFVKYISGGDGYSLDLFYYNDKI